MRGIGTKTLIVMALFILTLVLVLKSDRLNYEQAQSLSAQAGYCIGFFSVLLGTWFFRFWSLGLPSKSSLRLSSKSTRWEGEQPMLEIGGYGLLVGTGETASRALDLPGWLLRSLSVAICLLVAFLCFDTRTVSLMRNAPRKLLNAGARFCPKEHDNSTTNEIKKPGCELMYRAFKLGFIKSLGSCEPDEKEEILKMCYARQWDEPWLHYSSRLMNDFFQTQETNFIGKDIEALFKLKLETQLEHSDAILGKLKYVVKSEPKSSHHIFTNLPYPRGALAAYWESWFDPSQCMVRYHRMPHEINPDPKNPAAVSQLLDHVYGQMLFNSKYADAVGSCKEYTIHWSSKADSCEKLAQDPKAFLLAAGIWEPIQNVLKHSKDLQDYDSLQTRLKAIGNDKAKIFKALPSPESIISFQCFMKSPDQTELHSRDLTATIDDQKFSVRETLFPMAANIEKVHVELYKYFSQMMSENFHYVGYMSHEDASTDTPWSTSASGFGEGDYPLARLEHLKGVDIFLGHDWIQQREDLLEVYPYYHHLYHYVDLFRRQYRLTRTRL